MQNVGSQKLRNCPFCGGEAKLIKNTLILRNNALSFDVYITCDHCHISTPPHKFESEVLVSDDGDVSVVKDGKAEAVEFWNSRPGEEDAYRRGMQRFPMEPWEGGHGETD